MTPRRSADGHGQGPLERRRSAPADTAVPATTRVVAIASGKGGVGKSSVTVNLAAALAARGLTVGVLDADIWGFSVPRMLGVSGPARRRGARRQEADRPARAHDRRRARCGSSRWASSSRTRRRRSCGGASCSTGASQHFLAGRRTGATTSTTCSSTCRPGTGDVQMGLAQLLPRAEVIIVTTPARQPPRRWPSGPSTWPARATCGWPA